MNNEIEKHDSDSSESALLNLIAEKGMEAFDKMIDKNAATERYKTDVQKEMTFKRIEATERIKKQENIIGGIAMAALIAVILWLSLTDNLTVGNSSILVAALVGAIGKFLGVSLPRNDPR